MTNPLTAITALTARLVDPAGRFAVIDSCNGNRSFKALLILALILTVLNRNKLRHALILILSAAVLSVIFNQLRVSALILLGHLTHDQWLLAHHILGYLCILPPIFILIKLSERLANETAAQTGDIHP